jgi:hypothetical protein
LPFFAFFFGAMVLFSLPFFMDYATVFSCTLIECIESIKSDVKKKIAPASARDRHTKVTREVRDEIFFRAATIIHPLHAKNSHGTHLSIALHTIMLAAPRCACVGASIQPIQLFSALRIYN